MKVIETFVDRDRLASKPPMSRSAWPRLVAALLEADAGTVIVSDLSRISPLMTTQEAIVAVLKQRGFSVLSEATTKPSKDLPARETLRELCRTMQAFELSLGVSKKQLARDQSRLARGLVEGRKPFGRDASERRAIKRMAELRLERLGFDRIAARLNDEKVPTRTGKPWHGWW